MRDGRLPVVAITVVALLGLSGCAGDAPPTVGPEPRDPDVGPAETVALTGPRIRVLGTVQDGGLPHAGCDCPRCEAARRLPDRKRTVASLAVVSPEERLTYLIDATPDLRDQLTALRDSGAPPSGGVNRSPVSGVLLTHAHIGHYTGLMFFGFESVHTRGLPVFCTPRMAAFLRGNGPWSQLVGIGNITLHETPPGASFRLGREIEVTPIKVPHRDEFADTVGFVIRGPRSSALYVPDTDNWRTWRPSLPEVLEGIDLAILDGTFYSGYEVPGRDPSTISHPPITASMDLLGPLVDAGKLTVYLSHLNHTNPALDPASPERAEMESRGFRVLEEGQELPL